MQQLSKPSTRRIAIFTTALLVMVGCGGSSAPSAVTIELPDGTEVRATQGSGVITLADSQWDFFRTSSTAQGTAFVRIQFGSAGELTRFDNNTIASAIFGSTLIFDGVRHNTTQAGLQYSAATFGAETSDSSGFAFEGRLTAFAAGLEAASATASASGTFDPDDPDVMTGTFTFRSRVTLLDIPEGNIDDSFTFIGRRVTE